MKFSYEIYPEHRLSVLRFTGAITVGDVVRGIQQLWADKRYRPEYNGIVNLQGATAPRAGLEDVKSLLAFLRDDKVSVSQWAAIFTEPKPTALAMIMKAALPGPMKLEVVSSWEAACRVVEVNLPAEMAEV